MDGWVLSLCHWSILENPLSIVIIVSYKLEELQTLDATNW